MLSVLPIGLTERIANWLHDLVNCADSLQAFGEEEKEARVKLYSTVTIILQHCTIFCQMQQKDSHSRIFI